MSNAIIPENKSSTTTVTATAINTEHGLVRTSIMEGIKHAIRCGELLQAKKAELARGQFDGWVEANCEFGRATAYNYIKVFDLSKSSKALDDSAIRHLYPSGRPDSKKGDAKVAGTPSIAAPAPSTAAVFTSDPEKAPSTALVVAKAFDRDTPSDEVAERISASFRESNAALPSRPRSSRAPTPTSAPSPFAGITSLEMDFVFIQLIREWVACFQAKESHEDIRRLAEMVEPDDRSKLIIEIGTVTIFLNELKGHLYDLEEIDDLSKPNPNYVPRARKAHEAKLHVPPSEQRRRERVAARKAAKAERKQKPKAPTKTATSANSTTDKIAADVNKMLAGISLNG